MGGVSGRRITKNRSPNYEGVFGTVSDREITPKLFAATSVVRELQNRTRPSEAVLGILKVMYFLPEPERDRIASGLREVQEQFDAHVAPNGGNVALVGTWAEQHQEIDLLRAVDAFGEAANEHHQYLYDTTVVRPTQVFAGFLVANEQGLQRLRKTA